MNDSTTGKAPRTALVTGGNRGLGRAAAVSLARRGFRVILTHRGSGGAADTLAAIESEGGSAIPLRLDLTQVDRFAAFAVAATGAARQAWGDGSIDVLVNNAGIGLFGPSPTSHPISSTRPSRPMSAARSSSSRPLLRSCRRGAGSSTSAAR